MKNINCLPVRFHGFYLIAQRRFNFVYKKPGFKIFIVVTINIFKYLNIYSGNHKHIQIFKYLQW